MTPSQPVPIPLANLPYPREYHLETSGKRAQYLPLPTPGAPALELLQWQ